MMRTLDTLKKLKETLLGVSQVLILFHNDPDTDAIAAACDRPPPSKQAAFQCVKGNIPMRGKALV